MNTFTFNGKTSSSFGLSVEHWPNMKAPVRRVEKIVVPGRSGDLTYDTGAFDNVDMEYQVYFNSGADTFFERTSKILNWLLGSNGYCQLSDTYNTAVFRQAILANQEEVEDFLNRYGRTRIVFDCKPQKWLFTGASQSAVVSGATVTNNYMPSYPLFKATGNGSITVGTDVLTITNNSGKTMTIDCETMNCYDNDGNRNADVTVTGNFPVLKTGSNVVTYDVSTLTMAPRWWTL